MGTVGEFTNFLEDLNLISIIIRIFLSMVCGGVIGIERGRAHQAAGMRTYMLVCMGATMVMMTGQYMYIHFQTGDPARLGAQVVSGIGFLGAGSIIIAGKTRIRGLTTAAGLWTAACIGLSLGIGFYEAGIVATVAVFLIMTRLRQLEYHWINDDEWFRFYVEMEEDVKISRVAQELLTMGIQMGEMRMEQHAESFQKAVISLSDKNHRSRDEITKYLERIDGVLFVKYTI